MMDKNTLLIYLLSAALIVMAACFVLFIVFVHLKKLKIKDLAIREKDERLNQLSLELEDDARYKEEYFSSLFSIISGYILKLDKLKWGIERKVRAKKYEDILLSLAEINTRKERDWLFNTFDQTFIKMFPNFIAEFNSMLKKEDQEWPAKHEGLTTDLRIYALMRLGINDCKTVADILEYSANTIYVYKMRVKAKAILPGDQFDQAIMAIKAKPFDEKLIYRKSA